MRAYTVAWHGLGGQVYIYRPFPGLSKYGVDFFGERATFFS